MSFIEGKSPTLELLTFSLNNGNVQGSVDRFGLIQFEKFKIEANQLNAAVKIVHQVCGVIAEKEKPSDHRDFPNLMK